MAEANAADVVIPSEHSHLSDHPDIGIIVVLDEELAGIEIAVKAAGGELGSPLPAISGGRASTNLFWRTVYHGYNLIICKTDKQGQLDVMPAVESLVNHFRVCELVLIGVSGGLGDSRVGDVIVADDVDDVAHRGDVVDETVADGSVAQHRFGGAHFLPTDAWAQEARQFKYVQSTLFHEWKAECGSVLAKTIPPACLGDATVFARGGVAQHVGVIASGTAVVKSDAEKARLKQRSRLFLAVDTESAGFAAHVLRCLRDRAEGETLRFCVLRGISDMAGEENKKKMEAMEMLNNPPFTNHQKVLQVIATYNAFVMFGALVKAGMFRSAAGGTVEEFMRLEELKEKATGRFKACEAKTLQLLRTLAAQEQKTHISIRSRDGLSLLEYRRTDKKGRKTLPAFVEAVKLVVGGDSETWRAIEDKVPQPVVIAGGTESVKSVTMAELSNKRRKPEDVSAAAVVVALKKGDSDVDGDFDDD